MPNHTIDSLNSTPEPELIEQLKLATAGLSWQSEAEFPLEVVYWDDISNLDETILLEKYNYSSETKIAVQQFHSFFSSVTKQEDWHNREEQAEAIRYQSLVDLLIEKLTDIRVYLLGDVEINAYVLGKTKHEAIAGFTTKIVST